MSAQIMFYVIDYILYFLIRWNSDQSDDVDQKQKYNIPHQLVPRSCGGVTWYALILCVNAVNIWMCIYTIWTATARFEIKGLLSTFVPDSVTSLSLLELGDSLTAASMVDMNYASFLMAVYYLSIVVMPITVNVLLFIIWSVPMCIGMNRIYGLMELLWFLQAWNGLDALWLASWGLLFTGQTTKYMIDSILPDQCGAGNIVEEITGEDCGYITSTYTYGMGLLTATVVLNHCSILYAEYQFGPKATSEYDPKGIQSRF